MNYFDNKFFSIGITLIFLSTLITALLEENSTNVKIEGSIALIGLISMIYGVYQYTNKSNTKK